MSHVSNKLRQCVMYKMLAAAKLHHHIKAKWQRCVVLWENGGEMTHGGRERGEHLTLRPGTESIVAS